MEIIHFCILDCLRRRLAEDFSRESQTALNIHGERVRATEHASRDPFCVSERLHGLAEIVECGVDGVIERLRVCCAGPLPRRPTAGSTASKVLLRSLTSRPARPFGKRETQRRASLWSCLED